MPHPVYWRGEGQVCAPLQRVAGSRGIFLCRLFSFPNVILFSCPNSIFELVTLLSANYRILAERFRHRVSPSAG